MRTIAVIPARFQSRRLPGKPLAKLHGKTMVERVYERATEASFVERVLVATDDERIRDAVSAFGGEAIMTSPEHASGSDRVAEAVANLDIDLVVNLQGDEPLIDPRAIDDAVRLAAKTPRTIVTLRTSITERSTLLDPNAVKVVTNSEGFALYFSRSPVPVAPTAVVDDDVELPQNLYYKHVGLYVYPKATLLELTRMTPSPLERAERLEQLRALENGIPIRLQDTDDDSISVDTAADLERVRAILATRIAVNSKV